MQCGQHSAIGMPRRGEPSVRPFFVWCRVCPNALGVRTWASGGEPTEQRAGRKKIRLSERSELPDFPTCERREGV
ncbi:hypothetical protein [Tannerella forsythia]|uniref:hypothetical protein n=1 Tax=Tannerella forsythia TaxID=28112 RepID=UPI0028ED8EFA|nr:hypothetical protein [Tannerella forsythia]